MAKKSIPTEDTHDIRISITMNKAQVITMAAMLAEGFNRGPEHCLRAPFRANDVAVFNHYAPGVLSFAKKILDQANELS